ncbi:hypothetical protein SAMN05444411_102427 [Lutibacter oricola]|uniref:Uncharacterized protein n=1 Tax=Lutibacter oricola TaxID=762486 RepID=A0A1H2XCU5_9FLAO|nr:hypothetical protein [Lutibacter oricola]SDW90274.1 hypothetical protein SAMN05444411_102427 [Lutibacter oricola]
MKKIGLIILLTVLVISCKKQSQLSARFDCGNESVSNTKQILDFNKNFKVSIPSSWNTQLHYSTSQSQIFTADTTKQLSKTYILDTSFNYGEINFDSDFIKKTDSIIKSKNLILVTSEKEKFKNKDSFWYVVKGLKQKMTYHQLNMIIKLSNNTYFSANVDVYGDTRINERLCESLSILNSVEFLE